MRGQNYPCPPGLEQVLLRCYKPMPFVCRSSRGFHQVRILDTHECHQCGHRPLFFGWWTRHVTLASLPASLLMVAKVRNAQALLIVHHHQGARRLTSDSFRGVQSRHPRDVVELYVHPYSARPYLTEFDLLALDPITAAEIVEHGEGGRATLHLNAGQRFLPATQGPWIVDRSLCWVPFRECSTSSNTKNSLTRSRPSSPVGVPISSNHGRVASRHLGQ